MNTKFLRNYVMGTAIFVGTVGLAVCASAQTNIEAGEHEMPSQFEVRFVGHIEDPQIEKLVQDEYWAFFSEPFVPNADRRLADHLEIYIAPDIVQNSVFVPPTELNFSPEHLAAFEGKYFPNQGCQIRRLFFPDSEGYVVVLIDSSDSPELGYIKTCLLGAIATALGENLDEQSVMSNDEIRERIKGIVDGS